MANKTAAALDPEVAAFYAGKNFDYRAATVKEMRRNADAAFNDSVERAAIYHTESLTIPGPGGPLPLRLYQPRPGENFPVLLYFHGGGFLMHNLASHDSLCRMLAREGNCLVLSVGYRLAPEAPYPAAVEDAWAAREWAAGNICRFHGDPNRILAGGDSAGANISAALALMDRDRHWDGKQDLNWHQDLGPKAPQDAGSRPRLAGLLLFYGTYGCLTPEESPSAQAFGGGDYVLPRPMLALCEELYTPAGLSPEDPYRYPGRARDLSGLPPALCVTAEFDPLRDDGEVFARRLQEAGNQVVPLRAPGMMHGFLLYWYRFSRVQGILRTAGRMIRQFAKRP